MARNRYKKEMIIMVGSLLLLSRHAYAYIDPGTGSFLIQMLIGAVVGAVITIKIYWRKLKGIFAGKIKENE